MAKAKTKEPAASLFETAAGQPKAATPPTPEQPKPVKEKATTGKVQHVTSPTTKGEVAIHKPKGDGPARVVPMTNQADVLGMIERLAVNKDVDPEKLGKLLDLQERLLDRGSRMAFDQALVDIQPELPVISRDGKIIVRAKDPHGERTGKELQNTPYAKWETIATVIKPVLHKHGLGLTHRIGTAPDGRVRVTAILKGHGWTDDACYFDLGADSTGSKNNAQAWASSVSYAKRHTACAVLNIITKGEDDDAKASGKPKVVGDPITEEEQAKIVEYAMAVGCPGKHLLKHLNESRPTGHPVLEELVDLPRSRFDETIEALRSYEANKKARDEAEKAKGGKE